VEVAAGAVAALEMLQKGRYSIVFCDYNMPGQDGAAVVSTFRAWESANRQGQPIQPIWGLTGEQSDEVAKACREAGMHGVLMKPLDTAVALQLLKESER